jgi:hypothetical protein
MSILHEGFSVRHGKGISGMMGTKPCMLFLYGLEGKSASDKVRFSYALYGRKKGEGFSSTMGGEEIGKGALLVPAGKSEAAKEFFYTWAVNAQERRVWVLER